MQTQKELVSLHPAGGILNVDILSFQRLAYRIFEETGGSLYPVLEETGKSLVVKRVAQEKKKELTILGSTLKRTGAVSQMKSLISELKQYQIAPSELDTWAEETGEKKLLAAKLKDTGVIYRAFEEYLENRYVTAEDVLEVLAGKLEESSLIRNSEVLVDGFTGFTPVQIGVLGKLFRLCEKVYVTIIMDEREDPYKKAIPHQLFAMSRQLDPAAYESGRRSRVPSGAGNLGQTLGTWPFSAGKHDGSVGTEPVSIWNKKDCRNRGRKKSRVKSRGRNKWKEQKRNWAKHAGKCTENEKGAFGVRTKSETAGYLH